MKAAVFVGTRNIYADMIPSCKSLLMRSDVDCVYFLIEDDVFPYELPKEVTTINVRNQTYFRAGGPNWNSKWSWMLLLKTALPKIFTGYDKILCLDNDIIVTEDISELWEIPLDGYYLAGVEEPLKSRGSLYVNSGVILYNLELLRTSGKVDEIITALNKWYFEFVDQDCINELCAGKIKQIPSIYNANDFTAPCENPKIIHYAFKKNWRTFPLVNEYREIPWGRIRCNI